MVGDRWFPGATILGSEFVYFFRQPSPGDPADRLRTSRRLLVWTVYEMAGPVRSDGFIFLFCSVRCCGVLVASCCGSSSLLCLDDARRSSSVLGRSSRALFFSWPAGLNCFFLASCSSGQWAPSREPLCLGGLAGAFSWGIGDPFRKICSGSIEHRSCAVTNLTWNGSSISERVLDHAGGQTDQPALLP